MLVKFVLILLKPTSPTLAVDLPRTCWRLCCCCVCLCVQLCSPTELNPTAPLGKSGALSQGRPNPNPPILFFCQFNFHKAWQGPKLCVEIQSAETNTGTVKQNYTKTIYYKVFFVILNYAFNPVQLMNRNTIFPSKICLKPFFNLVILHILKSYYSGNWIVKLRILKSRSTILRKLQKSFSFYCDKRDGGLPII